MMPNSYCNVDQREAILTLASAAEGEDDRFSSWDKIVALLAALVTTQYAANYSGPLNTILPAAVLGPALLLSMRHFDWPSGIFWLTYSFLLMSVAMLSTLVSAHLRLRGLIFGFACFQPFMLLAFAPRKFDRFMKLYCVISAALIAGNVFLAVCRHGVGPWRLTLGANGAFLNMLWPLLLALSLNSRSERNLGLLLLAMATMIASFLVFSRAGLGTLLFGVCVLLFRKRAGIFILIAMLITCLVATAPQSLSDSFREFLAYYRIIDFEPQNPRTLIWALAEQAIRQHFFWGVGPGNAKFYLFTTRPLYEAHNVVIHAAMEMGFLAAALIVFLEAYVLVLIVRLLRMAGQGPFIAVALTAYVIHSMVEAYTNHPAQTVILTITISYARAVLRQSDESATR